MTTVVVGGSRQISRLTTELKRRLDRIIEQRFHVVIGDAHGADKATRADLAKRIRSEQAGEGKVLPLFGAEAGHASVT